MVPRGHRDFRRMVGAHRRGGGHEGATPQYKPWGWVPPPYSQAVRPP